MNKIVKTTLIVGGTAAVTLAIANVMTDGAVMDAIKEKIHPAAEAAADAAQSAAEAVADATAAQ